MALVLYTMNLRGDLDMLPRLYTYLKSLRAELAAENEPVAIVDLGHACDPDVWHCAITGGRSTYIALDGLGYTAANVTALSVTDRDKLTNGLTALGLVAENRTHTSGNWVFAVQPTDGADHICVVMSPGDRTRLDHDTLTLQAVNHGQVGVVKLDSDRLTIVSFEIRDIPADTRPDPTIAGVIDFVVGEARYFQKRQAEQREDDAP